MIYWRISNISFIKMPSNDTYAIISQYLPISSFVAYSAVNKQLRIICRIPYLWKLRITDDFYTRVCSNYKAHYITQYSYRTMRKKIYNMLHNKKFRHTYVLLPFYHIPKITVQGCQHSLSSYELDIPRTREYDDVLVYCYVDKSILSKTVQRRITAHLYTCLHNRDHIAESVRTLLQSPTILYYDAYHAAPMQLNICAAEIFADECKRFTDVNIRSLIINYIRQYYLSVMVKWK